jgi:hypothetical protein
MRVRGLSNEVPQADSTLIDENRKVFCRHPVLKEQKYISGSLATETFDKLCF